MSIKTDAIMDFRKEFEKKIDETIKRREESRDKHAKELEDNPIRKIMVIDWWNAKIDELKFAKDLAMVTETSLLADYLNEDLDLIIEAKRS